MLVNPDEIKTLWENFKTAIIYKNRYFADKRLLEILNQFIQLECSLIIQKLISIELELVIS